MGYCVSQNSSRFSIAPQNVAGAYQAIRAMADRAGIEGNSGTYGPGGLRQRHYSWVDTDELREAQTLDQALRAWSYEIEINPITNEHYDLVYEGEKLGQEFLMLQAIAPFVDAGCYIEMRGEDGESWRWVFDGKTCVELHPTVTW